MRIFYKLDCCYILLIMYIVIIFYNRSLNIDKYIERYY